MSPCSLHLTVFLFVLYFHCLHVRRQYSVVLRGLIHLYILQLVCNRLLWCVYLYASFNIIFPHLVLCFHCLHVRRQYSVVLRGSIHLHPHPHPTILYDGVYSNTITACWGLTSLNPWAQMLQDPYGVFFLFLYICFIIYLILFYNLRTYFIKSMVTDASRLLWFFFLFFIFAWLFILFYFTG